MFKNFDALLYVKNSLYFGISEDEIDFFEILTGLKSSAGATVISGKKSAVFVDGRYELAAEKNVDQEKFSIESLSKKNIIFWIKKNVKRNSKIAFDPKFFTHSFINDVKKELSEFEFLEINLEEILNQKKSKRNCEIISWKFDEKKFQPVYETISKNNLDGYLICDPCSSSWLMNKRDLNTKNTPAILGYLLITKNKEKIFFADDNLQNFDEQFVDENFSQQKKLNELQNYISKFEKIGADFFETSCFVNSRNLVDVKNPIQNIKYIKTDEEIKNIIEITKEDSIALIDFIYWFYNHENISELDCVEKIFSLRKRSKNFVGNSFDTIAAADANSAIVHYSPTSKTNSLVKKFLLLDSGGQYTYGTTDITRTFAKKIPNPQEKLYYTLVLKGHIAVANSELKKGQSCSILDKFARQFLKQYSLDYNHSTGHGIGYMLNVHEGPIAISKNNLVPLEKNILLSNEPGVYIKNHLGIRLENMMISREKNGSVFFETISLVPFDFNFIEFSLLDFSEKLWLKNYNEKIFDSLNLSNSIANWLKKYFIEKF